MDWLFCSECTYLIILTLAQLLEKYRNPFGTMQGGMIATAVDNTIGPLRDVVAPPNVTRTLEMRYSHPVNSEME
jgi:acyl-coenzyme A thioesterase PaaI-like protein